MKRQPLADSMGQPGTLNPHPMDQFFFNFTGVFIKSKNYIGSAPLSGVKHPLPHEVVDLPLAKVGR